MTMIFFTTISFNTAGNTALPRNYVDLAYVELSSLKNEVNFCAVLSHNAHFLYYNFTENNNECSSLAELCGLAALQSEIKSILRPY